MLRRTPRTLSARVLSVRGNTLKTYQFAALLFVATLVAAISGIARADDADGGTEWRPALEQQRVRMADGTEVSVCLVKPPDARRGQRFPVLFTTDGYAGPCGYFSRPFYNDYVKGGYVVAYAQVRGTGDSDGTFPDKEYSTAELADAVELIDWLARQPWSTGRIGMFGTSWSGINSLLVGARKPPALEAVVSIMASENLYHEDVRFPDGIFHVDDYVIAADLMLVGPPGLTMPAIPAESDPFDEQMLRQRFDQQPWSLAFLRQQRDGAFWSRELRRDVNPQAGAVPTMMIGAWHDPYRTAVLRALERSSGPVRAVVGPWNHSGDFPGPEADLGRVTLEWWDHFLKGEKGRAAPPGPEVSVYMRRPYRPIIDRSMIPGEWRSFARWKDAPITTEDWALTAERAVSRTGGSAAEHRLRMIPSTGVSAGIGWIDVAPDQRPGDSTALVYQSAPFTAETQILGRPVVRLEAAVDASRANFVVKLSDVAPDGSTTMITGGAINGAHRKSSVEPQAMVPGQRYTLDVPMHFTSWIFQPGHRLSVSVANAMFPAYWPSADAVEMRLAVGEGGSTLTLPVLPAQPQSAAERAAVRVGSRNVGVAEAEEAGTGAAATTWNGPRSSRHSRDDIARTTTVRRTFQWFNPEVEDVTVEFTVDDDDPAKSSFVGTAFIRSEWRGQKIELRGTTEIVSDATTFNYRHLRQLLRDGQVVREREWTERVPRDFQ